MFANSRNRFSCSKIKTFVPEWPNSSIGSVGLKGTKVMMTSKMLGLIGGSRGMAELEAQGGGE